MEKDVVILCCGDSHKAREIAEALSRKSETTCSVIVLEEKLDDFVEQVVDGFQLRDPCNFDCTEIVREPPPKYLFNGKLKRR